MIFHKLVLGTADTNCYIFGDEGTNEVVVIDPASQPQEILDIINKNNYIVKYIIITHGHFDHIMALGKVKELTGALVAIGEYEKDFIEDANLNLAGHLGYKWQPVQADILLSDGDILKLSNLEIKVIYTPGHTKGGICLLCGDVLFSGDTLFNTDIGRCDLPTGNLHQLIDTIKSKLLTLDEATIVYPGHANSTTIAHEKANNQYLKEDL